MLQLKFNHLYIVAEIFCECVVRIIMCMVECGMNKKTNKKQTLLLFFIGISDDVGKCDMEYTNRY